MFGVMLQYIRTWFWEQHNFESNIFCSSINQYMPVNNSKMIHEQSNKNSSWTLWFEKHSTGAPVQWSTFCVWTLEFTGCSSEWSYVATAISLLLEHADELRGRTFNWPNYPGVFASIKSRDKTNSQARLSGIINTRLAVLIFTTDCHSSSQVADCCSKWRQTVTRLHK